MNGIITSQQRPNRRRRRGFTLVELLIALVVVAITAATIYPRTGDMLRQLQIIERRTLAVWVAENELNKLRIERLITTEAISTGTSRERLKLGDRDWEVVRIIGQTSHPWLRRVDMEVYRVLEDETVGPVHTITAFIGRY